MKPFRLLKRPNATRGAAALELAVFFLFAISFLAMPLSVALYFWHYSAIQKAAQNSAAYLATVSAEEMKSYDLAAYAETMTRQIANDATADLIPSTAYRVYVECDLSAGLNSNDWLICGDSSLPSQVRVVIRMRLSNSLFNMLDGGDSGLLIRAESRMRYVGN